MNPFHSQARILKVLAHPARLRLLHALCDGEECVCHLTALMRQRQAYVSQQLMFLRQAGLLADRKEGARVYYRIKDPRLLPVLEAMNVIGADKANSPGPSRLAHCACPKCATGAEKPRSKRRASSGPKQRAP